MKVQSAQQLLDAVVADCAGRGIGRVVEVHTGADRFTVAWLVVRVSYWRLRVLPADGAIATMTGFHVPIRRDQVVASPPLRRKSRTSDWAAAVESYYGQRFSQDIQNSDPLAVGP